MRLFKSLMCCLGLLCLGGCMELDLFRFQNTDKERDMDESRDRHKETDFVGQFAAVTGNNVIAIHGVGLVTGLEGTGEDPPPSVYRTQLEDDMKKRGVHNFRELLQSPSTALVLLTAYLPADIRKGDSFDVEVRLPPNSEATSLQGGWLLPADLTEQANVQGAGTLKGKIFGRVTGPILCSVGRSDKSESLDGVLKRGRILGGGIAFKERTLGLYLRSDFKNTRNTSRIADKIGARFHHYEHGQKKSLATAKDDQYVELKVHPRYKDNYPRYMQVIRHVAFRENDIQRRDRMERLQEDLLDPERAAKAAIQYEAIGTESAIFLKKGLNHTSPEVRFYSAEALAYLGDDSGAEQLATLARTEPAFRVYCLAAMSALDEAVCFQLLRDLMDETSTETKYGAFRALWTLDREDPAIRGVRLNEQYMLHVVDSKGDPMIHLTRHRRPEIVLFGVNQKFTTPLALTAGNHINVNAQPGSDQIVLSRFGLGKSDQRKVVSTKVVDVIMAAAEMGATYPDIAQLLSQASQQYNVEGRVEFDALPQAGRLYYRTVAGDDKETRKSTKVGRASMIPNLFPSTTAPGEEPKNPEDEEEDEMPMEEKNAKDEKSKDLGEASLTDIRKESKSSGSSGDDAPPAQAKPRSWMNLFGKPKVTTAPDESEEKAKSKPESVKKSDAGLDEPDVSTTDSSPPAQGTGAKFEIE